MKRVLLTGATGFIGRQCVPLLVARGNEIHAVSGKHAGLGEGAEWHQTDLLAPGEAEALVARVRPTHLLHLAWYPSVPGKFWTALENFRWVEASLALLRAFEKHGGQRVVVAGTCAEYDWDYGVCVEEVTPLAPATLYGTCKYALHSLFGAFCRQTGLSGAWGRIFLLYGPHEHPARLVAYVIASLLRGEPAECSSGHQVRDFLHVGDVASAFVTLLDAGICGPVNIGSGAPTSLKDIVTTIGEKIGRPDLIRLGARPALTNDPQLLVPDVRRLQAALGWKPRYTLGPGLDDVIEWWRNLLGDGRGGLDAEPGHVRGRSSDIRP